MMDDTQPPDYIGRYDIKGEIGRGAVGTVYRARDPLVKRPVAIKLIRPEQRQDERALARFQREAEIVAQLEHSSLVAVYDYGLYMARPYIVMPYMFGGSLEQRLNEKPLSLEHLAEILDRIAPGLDAAHRQKIVHRDIKPANILFDKHNVAYLADFGIAYQPPSGADQTDPSQPVLGTPEFMSPEQVRGRKIDGRSDVYALGVLIFYALTRIHPFRSKNSMSTAIAHIMDPIPSIRTHRPNLPAETDQLLQKALAKEPADRFQTAAELAENVRLLADGRGYLLRLTDL